MLPAEVGLMSAGYPTNAGTEVTLRAAKTILLRARSGRSRRPAVAFSGADHAREPSPHKEGSGVGAS